METFLYSEKSEKSEKINLNLAKPEVPVTEQPEVEMTEKESPSETEEVMTDFDNVTEVIDSQNETLQNETYKLM